jgi:mannose-1-phosphate guanylyltransferase/phosphomannomutase
MAYATALKRGSVVAISRDTSRSARALKRSIIGALNLSGIDVMDLELATVPLTRFQVRSLRAQGGLTVRLAPGAPDAIEIRIFDADGADIDEGMQRKIERILYREDFRRAFAGDIGDIVFPPRAMEFYTAALEASVDGSTVRAHGFKVVVDYSFGAASIVMPNVLPKVGAEVLGVNPFASTASASAAVDDRELRLARLGDLVRTSGSDLGFVFDPDGETATIIDDMGVPLSTEQALLVLVTLVCDATEGARLALPVSTTRAAERIAAAHGATVTFTKLSAAHLMEIADAGDVDFAASQEGGFIWPDFLPAYDAAATLLKLLHLLAKADRSLSSLREEIPEIHTAHEAVPTPWERKGAVMRGVVERAKDLPMVLVDGVKLEYPEGWALILPDPELPVTHVWAEADTEPDARRLVAVHAGWIAELVR